MSTEKKNFTPVVTLLVGLVVGIFVGIGLYDTVFAKRLKADPLPVMDQSLRGQQPTPVEMPKAPVAGDHFGAELMNQRLFPGHPLTVIQNGKIVDNPDADQYYYGDAKPIQDATPVTLREIAQNSKYTLVAFSSSTCPFCGAIYPYYRELHEKNGDDLQIVVIYDSSANLEEANNKLAYLKEQNIGKPDIEDYSFIKVLAAERDALMKFGEKLILNRVPSLFWINKEGEITYIPTPHDMDTIFQKIMAPEVAETEESIEQEE